MGIFFRFGDSKLAFSVFRQVFAQCVFKRLRLIGHRHIFERLVILCQANIVNVKIVSFKSAEIFVNKRPCDFTRSVRAEIEKYNGISRADCGHRF